MESEKLIQKELISNPSTKQSYLIGKGINLYAGSIKNFENQLNKYIKEKEVLSMVLGLPIDFHSDHFAQNSGAVELKFCSKQEQFTSNQIKKLVEQGCTFICSIFLVP